MPHKTNLLALVLLFSVISCGWVTRTHFYISLERVPGIEVLEREKLNIEGLFGNSKIPTSYKLERKKYDLYLSLKEGVLLPHMRIVLENNTNEQLQIEPITDRSVMSQDGIICSTFGKHGKRLVDFGWSDSCLGEGTSRLMTFNILDADQELVAQERIEFDINEDGKYTLLDAI